MNQTINGDWTFEHQFHDVARRKANWQRMKLPSWGTKSKAEVDQLCVCGNARCAANQVLRPSVVTTGR